MDHQLLIIFFLTFIIHLIGTLAYSVRIAGTRTGRIAISFSLFNILVLVSRLSNSFQAPLLAKRVEEDLLRQDLAGVEGDFRWLLFAAFLATLAGALLIPTFQRLFARAVEHFGVSRSLPKMVLRAVSPAGIARLRQAVVWPARKNVIGVWKGDRMAWHIAGLNAVAMAIWTVGVFASLYAGYLHPDLRSTANSLSSVVNGLATILMFIVIDPYLSILTDDVAARRIGEAYFRRSIVWFVGSRLAGTLLAQILLVPAAGLIVFVAEKI